MIPPDERSVEQLETVLHIPVAVDYFYNFLELEPSLDNEFRLFALYMDLRCFDVEIRRLDRFLYKTGGSVNEDDISIKSSERGSAIR